MLWVSSYFKTCLVLYSFWSDKTYLTELLLSNLCSFEYFRKVSPKHRYLYVSSCFLSMSHSGFVAKKPFLFDLTLSLGLSHAYVPSSLCKAACLIESQINNAFSHYFPVCSTFLWKRSSPAHLNRNTSSLFFNFSTNTGAWLNSRGERTLVWESGLLVLPLINYETLDKTLSVFSVRGDLAR